MLKIKNNFTQEEIVKQRLKNRVKTIEQVFASTGILKPNIRRILSQGVKSGMFKRIARGVYTLGDITIVNADSIETLPRLADAGFKSDFIFLDIPYYTPAVRGGNRGIKYPGLYPYQFQVITDALKRIVRSDTTPIVYLYSQAPSGLKKMQEYNDCLTNSGFKIVRKGDYYKYYKDGIQRVSNMRGDIVLPEGILVLSKSGRLKASSPLKLNFHCVRPKGYQTEKPAYLIRDFMERLTKKGQMILDPFLGSGVTLAVARKLGRCALGIEITESVIFNYSIPKIERALQ